jgi:hypothetical protein
MTRRKGKAKSRSKSKSHGSYRRIVQRRTVRRRKRSMPCCK